MKTACKLFPLSLALLSAPNLASAQLSGNGELGFSDSTGNTDSTALYAALKMNYELDDFVLKSLLEASYKSEDDVQTEERYILDLQGNQFYTQDKSYYSFLGARFEKNKFEDIELETTVSLGLGKRLYQTDATKLTGELGLGHQNTDFVSSGTSSESQTVGLGKLDFSHQWNAQVTLLQDVSVRSGSEQTKWESNSGVKVKVAQKANLKLSYKYRHNDNPAPGTEKTDTQTLLTLTYDF